MTAKRFKIADYPTDIEDTVTGEKYPCSSYGTHMEIICDLLNTLHNENKQLKQKNKGLQSELHIFKEDVTHSNKIIDKLNDENRQLKEEIKDLNDVLARYEEKELME